MKTVERLDRVDHWLQQNRPEYHLLLRPGALDNELNAAEDRMGVQLSESFKSLYRWHDGQKPGDFTPLVQNLTFMTLPEIIEKKESLDYVARIDQWQKDTWWPNWIPFLDNGGGDCLCLDLGGFQTGNLNQLLWFDHETHEHEVLHKSLDEFLDNLYRRMLNNDLNLG